MNYKTHITGGIIAGSIVAIKINPEPKYLPIILGAAALGSLIPDIDHRNSYLGRRFKVTSYITSKAFGHRGAVHAPILMGLVNFGLYLMAKLFIGDIFLLKEIFISLYGGILSHLFLDMFNKTGIPVLYPFSGKYISFANVKVNSLSEKIIRIGLYVVLIYCQINLMS